MHSPDQALQISRDETRRLLRKALHRANDRQQQVARRRTNWRLAVRILKWGVVILGGLALVVWIVMQAGYVPGVHLITDQEFERLMSGGMREQNASVGVLQVEVAQPTAIAVPSPSPSSTPEQPVTPPLSSENNDAVSPVGLKAESQLNNLNP